MMRDNRLSRQLLAIILFLIATIFFFLGFLLPRQMMPIYEKNLYNYLRQPLDFIDEDISKMKNQEIGYVYIYNGNIVVSDNFKDVVETSNIKEVLQKIKTKYGKFRISKDTYYYYTDSNQSITRISITNDNYIKNAQIDAIHNFFPIILITVGLISLALILWSLSIVKKLEFLKQKVDHFEDDDFPHQITHKYNNASEIQTLETALEDMRISMKNEEEYRNQMYQNISHDFKTPLTVIKSYVEAIEDGALDSQEGLNVIQEQTDKLEQKVHSLLYLNKLDYMKELKVKDLELVDIEKIISSAVEKFKYRRKDITFQIHIDKNVKYYGTEDFWETVIDNILNNFLRYAEHVIKITVKKDKIVLYNDGENIDDELLESIFVPFRKGMKGEFGLGLSIVKKTLQYMNYDIQIKNHRKVGVSFIIEKD